MFSMQDIFFKTFLIACNLSAFDFKNAAANPV